MPHAHVTTTTTHKSLRGPRGGLILCNDEALAKKLNSAIFPGLQGGPLMHVIAAKAVAFAEALRPDFKIYAKNVVENAKALAETLRAQGFDIVSGGTDNHLMLVDLRPKGLKGNVSEKALVRAAITCNKNGIPFDPEKPFVTSGLRLGTPAATTRGFGVAEFKQVGMMISEVLNAIAQSQVARRRWWKPRSRNGSRRSPTASRSTSKGPQPDAMSELQQPRHAGGDRVRPRIPP